MRHNVLPPLKDKNLLIYSSMKIENDTDYGESKFPYKTTIVNQIRNASNTEQLRESDPIKSLDFIIRRRSQNKIKGNSKVVKYGIMEKIISENEETKENGINSIKRRSQNYEIKDLVKFHKTHKGHKKIKKRYNISQEDRKLIEVNPNIQRVGYDTIKHKKIARGINILNGNMSYISNSQSKFICMQSTFEDEDEVFNAIVNSKMHHVKRKQELLREEPHIVKQIKTIEEESIKEGYLEEGKFDHNQIENENEAYSTNKPPCQVEETIDFNIKEKFDRIYVDLITYLRDSCIPIQLRKEIREKEKDAFKLRTKQSISLCCCRESKIIKLYFFNDIKIIPLQSKDIEDKETLFCFAKISYTGHANPNPDKNKLKALYFCYISLIGNETTNNFDWTKIGFQNQSDPSSDFRGVGMFGILQMVYLIKNHLNLAKQIFHNAQESQIKFRYPMYCAGLALTKLVLERLRDGTIDRLFGEDDSIITISNQFYVKLFRKFDEIWVNENCTIRDFQRVMQEVSKFSKKLK